MKQDQSAVEQPAASLGIDANLAPETEDASLRLTPAQEAELARRLAEPGRYVSHEEVAAANPTGSFRRTWIPGLARGARPG